MFCWDLVPVLSDLPISFRVTSLALGQSRDFQQEWSSCNPYSSVKSIDFIGSWLLIAINYTILHFKGHSIILYFRMKRILMQRSSCHPYNVVKSLAFISSCVLIVTTYMPFYFKRHASGEKVRGVGRRKDWVVLPFQQKILLVKSHQSPFSFNGWASLMLPSQWEKTVQMQRLPLAGTLSCTADRICNTRYPSETHLKPKSREISFVHDSFPSYPIVLNLT